MLVKEHALSVDMELVLVRGVESEICHWVLYFEFRAFSLVCHA
jgi:hypothetical protein